MYRFRIRILLSIAAAFLFVQCSSFSGNVRADDSGTPAPLGSPDATPDQTVMFVIAPEGKSNGDFFSVELNPGETATLSGLIGNGSEIPVTATMYAADAYSGVNGGFILNESDEPVSAPTTWLDFPTTTHEFQPNEGLNTNFTVTVPEGTPPGQYITGIAIETANANPMSGSASLLVKYRLISAVLITVPGKVTPDFELEGVSIATDGQTTSITGGISNTGNIRLRPEGTLKVTDAKGTTVVDSPIKMSSVYAGDTTTYEITLPSPIAEGSYTVSVDLKDPDTGAVASIADQKVTVAKPVEPAPVSITNVSIAPMPSADNVVFAQVSATIENTGSPVSGGEVSLQVFRDGKQVDDTVLATSMTVQNGDTAIDQTYIPQSGKWEPGSYTFQLTLSSIDPASGTKSVVATTLSDVVIEVP
jgi:hypothetical protein